MKRLFLLLVTCILLHFEGKTQDIQRPPIWGVAKMTFLVSDFQVARDYYGKFLGFNEAFSYHSEKGEIISFKLNDRQFLEFIEDKDAKEKNRLVSVSFDCHNPGQMEAYLRSKNIPIIRETGDDHAGNEVMSIQSTEFYFIEFGHFKQEGLHKRSLGQFLGENRIAYRLHHAGLYISDVNKTNQLYHKILGFSEMWCFKENNDAIPNYIYMRMRDCVENIEYVVNGDSNSSHPCFRVDDMQETIYTLKERSNGNSLARPGIGKGKRWLLNLKNTDGTKVEFTESYTIY